MSDIHIIIVNHNSYDDCINCVSSIIKHNITNYNGITIIDNNSKDNSVKKLKKIFPEINLISKSNNRGFASAVNEGIFRVNSKYFIVLNPDSYFEENNLLQIVNRFSNDSRLGILGLNLIDADGTPQYSSRRFYNILTILLRRSFLGRLSIFTSYIDDHLMKSCHANNIFDVDWVLGNGMIINKEAFTNVGGMDEKFFLYMEDVDICLRMWIFGWKVCLDPQINLVHFHKRESARKFLSKANWYHLKSLLIFIKKYRIPIFSSPDVNKMKKYYFARQCNKEL